MSARKWAAASVLAGEFARQVLALLAWPIAGRPIEAPRIAGRPIVGLPTGILIAAKDSSAAHAKVEVAIANVLKLILIRIPSKSASPPF
jgi:hypothetical protein